MKETNNNSAAYRTPDIKMIEVDMANIICQSFTPTDFDPEIDELP